MLKSVNRMLAIPIAAALVGLAACSAGNGGEPAKPAESAVPVVQQGVGAPEWAAKAVMYEVNLRQFTKEGTFKAFEAHLPRLQELGVDILWFMPIHPISKTKRNGTLGSYYAVDDFKAVNPEFGTEDDFRSLVDKAHEMGFKVLLDLVANHTGWDNAWTANAGWYTTDEGGNIVQPPGTNWADVADLNYENVDMQGAMIDAMTYWVREFDVDGYRADYASGVPTPFWEQARAELEKVKPVYMLAEDDQQIGLLRNAFHANYGWQLYNVMNRVANGMGNAEQVRLYAERLAKSYPAGTYPLNFTSNHDENSWVGTEYERLGGAVKAMAALSFALPGMPLIYSGQEAGLDRRLLFFDKDEIVWDDLSMQTFYRQLVQLKHDNKALWNGSAGGPYRSLETGDDRLLAFERTKDGNTVVAVMNLSAEPVTSTVQLGDVAGKYQALNGAAVELPAEHAADLAPWAFEIYVKH
ncbi:alpha-amylase family glycosyl hydrolase [Paenibacillus sp. LHD-117]|uniref:alpha-amylase family glycosyl hydrolase n=1 Tax=Paenibacillus sp. LHD-117 TaxID=3071412 RepID=UPI0027E16DCF|nr:alpha-amylase family glycosyl hydrolase [Paenibacillus sp. LHD-117]MDQ6420940.1 alpha-amylase family glycosyl hydrolase [Paenibacillus sp. LHD-117]